MQDDDAHRDQRDTGVRLVGLMDDLADIQQRPAERDRRDREQEAARPHSGWRSRRRA
jgi:hypothetical protein